MSNQTDLWNHYIGQNDPFVIYVHKCTPLHTSRYTYVPWRIQGIRSCTPSYTLGYMYVPPRICQGTCMYSLVYVRVHVCTHAYTSGYTYVLSHVQGGPDLGNFLLQRQNCRWILVHFLLTFAYFCLPASHWDRSSRRRL